MKIAKRRPFADRLLFKLRTIWEESTVTPSDMADYASDGFARVTTADPVAALSGPVRIYRTDFGMSSGEGRHGG